MTRLESVEQYNNMLREAKRSIKDPITNIYIFKDDIQKLIDRKCIFFDNYEGMLLLYVDRLFVYDLYVYSENKGELSIEGLDKPVYTYFIKNKDADNNPVECEFFNRSGFNHVATYDGYDLTPSLVIKNTSSSARILQRSLEKSGYRFADNKSISYEKLVDFMEGIEKIPYWDRVFPYEDAFENSVNDKSILVIVNSNDEIVAANYSFVEGKYSYGWIAVKDSYKKTGVAIVLTNKRIEEMIRCNLMGRAWIDVLNYDSKRYHEGLGYIPNGRIREAYIYN